MKGRLFLGFFRSIYMYEEKRIFKRSKFFKNSSFPWKHGFLLKQPESYKQYVLYF